MEFFNIFVDCFACWQAPVKRIIIRVMATFGWFGDQEHRVFNYKPMYYDPETEKRRQMFGAVDGSVEREKKEGTYVPGSSIRGAFRDGNYAQKRSASKAHAFVGIVGLALLLVVLIYIAKFYALL